MNEQGTASQTPTVSVVIVNWNAKHYLAECLQSLKGVDCADRLEVIVVDNASSDGSPEMVRAQYPDVALICNDDNLGFARANNIGIRRCSGQYIALINSDVKVFRNCISRLVDYLEAHPRAGLVGPRIIGRDGKAQPSYRGFPNLWNSLCRAVALDVLAPRLPLFNGHLLQNEHRASTTHVDILSGCFWLARRAALEEVDLLDERFFIYGEDMDWCKRFWDGGWKVVFVADAQAVHYGGASSANAPVRFFIEMQRANCQYWRKHHSTLASGAYLAISVLHHGLRMLGHASAALLFPHGKAAHRRKAERSAACLKWMAANRLHLASTPAKAGR